MTVHKLLEGYANVLDVCSTSCVISTENINVVIDTGSRTESPALIHGLRNIDLSPEDIDGVVNTHLHMDHCWNNDLFPHAMHYCSEKEHGMLLEMLTLIHTNGVSIDEIIVNYLFLTIQEIPHLLRKNVRSFFYDDKIFEKIAATKRLPASLLDEEGIRIIETPGHTDGHIAIVHNVHEEDRTYIFTGDAVVHERHYGKDQSKVLFTKDMTRYSRSKHIIERHNGVYFPGHGYEFHSKYSTLREITTNV